MKKRYFFYAYIAFELACIPAAAQIIDRISFSVPQRVAAVEVENTPGKMVYAIASNAPFSITASETIGDMDVRVHVSGSLNGNPFGQNAQLPGAAQNCASMTSPLSSVIYAADKKTAATKGEVLSQAVLVEIFYDASTTPEFKVMTQKKAERFPLASSCFNIAS